MLRSLCVFCGSSSGSNPVYTDAAIAFGTAMADTGVELVYGGGRVGLMGTIADTVIARGGKATGIIPKFLVDREVAHTGLTDLIIVKSMHERKALMAEMSDGFVAMPGGFGTFEEFIEIGTWSLLGFHAKPCALLNVAGYYDKLLDMFANACTEGFLAERHMDMVLVDPDPNSLLSRLLAYEHTTAPKFSDEEAQLT
jgi:uncharacterized protein (TIGR00730 family)